MPYHLPAGVTARTTTIEFACCNDDCDHCGETWTVEAVREYGRTWFSEDALRCRHCGEYAEEL